MLVLGIDTATAWGTIGIGDEKDCLFEVSLKSGKGGGEYLLSLLDQFFGKVGRKLTEVELIATGTGPGSYTGIRVGLAAVQGLATGLKIPVYGVNTLRVIAENGAGTDEWVAPVIDARRNTVYAALYQNSEAGLCEVLAPYYTPVAQFYQEIANRAGVLICGDGSKVYRDLWEQKPGIKIGPSVWDRPLAGNLIRIAHQQWRPEERKNLTDLCPHYLRKVEAEVRMKERLDANSCCSNETGRFK